MTATISPHGWPASFVQECRKLAAQLEDGFGSPFHILANQGGEWFATDARSATPISAEAISYLREACSCDRPSIISTGAGENAVAVPLRARGAELVAVGRCLSPDPDLALRLATALVANWEHRRDLDKLSERLNDYACQVTCDFEELTWLRSLAEHVDVCDPRNGLGTVAKAILPGLTNILCAGAVLLYVTDENGVNTLACSIGDDDRGARMGLKLIAGLGPLAAGQPVVRNAASETESLDGYDGIHNCVLVRLAKGRRQFGWLLAVNKRSAYLTQNGYTPAYAGALSAWEFGTLEAGLLNSAGIMLTTHGNNNDSFRQIEQLLVGVIRAMINAIDAKDAYTCGHSDRVASMSRHIAQELGLSNIEQERIYMSGLLHDVGKIGVPDQVLGKPDKLSDEEFAQIKRHPEIGYAILKHLKQLDYVLPGVLYHHEAVDGRGYPHGLSGEAIPLIGRILAVADAYDAMTSTRPYRSAMPTEKAESILRAGAGKQWDARVVDAFFRRIEDAYRICGLNRSHTQALLDGQEIVARGSADEIAQAVMATLT